MSIPSIIVPGGYNLMGLCPMYVAYLYNTRRPCSQAGARTVHTKNKENEYILTRLL